MPDDEERLPSDAEDTALKPIDPKDRKPAPPPEEEGKDKQPPVGRTS